MSRNDLTEVRQRVDRLERRMGELERRLDVQEETPASDTADGLDRHDAAVVAVLEHGENYTANELRDLYLTETDLRMKSEAKRRGMALVKNDFFQSVEFGYVYRG